MQLHDFHYELPAELIAQAPLRERSSGRLLVLEGATGHYQDHLVRDLPELLKPGDLLVFNDTRVIAARLAANKLSGAWVELFLERIIGGHEALVQLRSGATLRVGMELRTKAGLVRLSERLGDLWRVKFETPAFQAFESAGEVPLPPYIRRAPEPADRERYQSIFAHKPGAVAAPTASLHFDEALIAALDQKQIERAFLTLHVGAGTFQPVRTSRIEDHVLHAEQVEINAAACAAVKRARLRNSRVIAVGTTVVRVLESSALRAHEAKSAEALIPFSGETNLFIRPGFEFRVTDAMITNFHISRSTLLMLVCAFAGREQTLTAYRHAAQARYRFLSYGDAMLVTPQRERAR